MATKRSFSEKVTGSDAFAELSFEAQALYLQLSMAADDEGFVSTPKKVQKGIGASAAALVELKDAGYLIFGDDGTCVITHWDQNNDEEDEDVKRRKKNRERVRRFRERKKEEEESASDDACGEDVTLCNADVTLCNADVTLCNADVTLCNVTCNADVTAVTLHTVTNPSPFSSPPLSPLSSFPHTPIYYTPYNPPRLNPPPCSSSSMFSARAQEFSVKYWGRKLKKYEKAELRAISLALAEERDGTEAGELCLSDEDIKLLCIAFSISADAGVCNIAYLRGIYEKWHDNGIYVASDYFKSEIKRGTCRGIISRQMSCIPREEANA